MCGFYKGRTTFTELMHMSLSDINVLYKIAADRAKSEEGKKQLEGEALEDGMEELMGG